MTRKDIAKELGKYSKEAIISAIISSTFLKEDVLSMIKNSETDLIFKQLDQVSVEIKNMGSITIDNILKYRDLDKKRRKLHKRLDVLLEIS